MKQKQSQITRFINNPLVRRIGAWLAPIVIGYVTKKLTQKTSSTPKSGRKYVKNKAE